MLYLFIAVYLRQNQDKDVHVCLVGVVSIESENSRRAST